MATAVSNNSGNWSDDIWDGGSGADGRPADGDAVTISAGHSVLMDSDLSAWTGLQTVTITSHATTPGMLYFKDGTNGYLKLRTGYYIMGTNNGVTKGRLLANSDGVWGNTNALTFANKAVILLEGTTRILGEYIDFRLYCTQPTNLFVETYKTAYVCADQTTGVNPSTDVITFGSAPPTAGTVVRIKSSGTLPGGLSADSIYYTRTVSGNTCKLALQNADAQIVDITSTGSGTLTMYDGHTDTGTKTLNVVQDVTGDTPWTTTANHNKVVLVDIGPTDYDQQRDTLTTINAGSMVFTTNNVDSAQYPLARIYLSSRNVSIRSSATATNQNIVEFTPSTGTGSVFQCEITSTYQPGTQTTFYSSAMMTGTGWTMSGVISGCSSGVAAGSGNTISGVICGCAGGFGTSGFNHTVSGIVAGCANGIAGCMSFNISGLIQGCSNGVSGGAGHIVSGLIQGCSNGCSASGIANIMSGAISGCNNGFYQSFGTLISGTISGCANGVNTSSNITITGTIVGCSCDFAFPVNRITMKSGSSCSFLYSSRGTNGLMGRISCEDHNKVFGVYKIIDSFGDILKTACLGVGDAPSVDPNGRNGYCIEASNIQANCSSVNKLLLFEHRIWLSPGSKTITYKVQTTYAGIAAGNLKLTARYISNDSPLSLSETTHAPAINQRSNNADWTQVLYVTINPHVASWVDLKMELMEYESGNEVYVWPTPVIS